MLSVEVFASFDMVFYGGNKKCFITIYAINIAKALFTDTKATLNIDYWQNLC